MNYSIDELRDGLKDLMNLPMADLSDQSLSPRTVTGACIMMEQARSQFPTLPSYPYSIDPHVWLTDLRKMQQMLEGEIKLPHEMVEYEFSDGTRVSTHLNYKASGATYNPIVNSRRVITCPTCSAAHDLRCKYILSKESQIV